MEDVADHDDGGAGERLDSLPPEQLAALDGLVAIASKQIDDGDFVEFDVDRLMAEGRVRRVARLRAAAA